MNKKKNVYAYKRSDIIDNLRDLYSDLADVDVDEMTPNQWRELLDACCDSLDRASDELALKKI